jgi:hypothetical protein
MGLEETIMQRLAAFARHAAAGLVLAAITFGPTPQANAGIWSWGCMGPLGGDQVVFNRYTLTVLPGHSSKVKLQQLTADGFDIGALDGTNFNSDDGNSGFVHALGFTGAEQPGQKLTLTEVSSRKVFERKGHVGPREENTTKFKKTYRYALEREPPRTITMDCIEYMLSTRGGR